MSMAMPGLATGMDTRDIVSQLMQIERMPQQQLKGKAAVATRQADALRALNTAVAALATQAKDAAKPAALQINTATSSSESVSVAAGPNAAVGELNFTVESVAARHTTVSAAVAEWPQASFTYTDAAGESRTIEATSTNPRDIATAINRSDSGMTATTVAAGDGTFRLQVSASGTGAQNSFTSEDVAMTTVTQGSDAEVVLWAGTEAEQRVTSSTNTFENLMNGVDVTVSAPTEAPVTIGVNRDPDASAAKVGELVAGMQAIFTMLSKSTAVSGDGEDVRGSVLTGDSTARTVRARLQEAFLQPFNGLSPSTIGIEFTRSGEVTFDEEKFAAAMADNPAAVEAMFSGLAERTATTATLLSDRYEGLITSRITGQDANVSRMENQISQWDQRLERRQSTLERTYARLEVAIQSMNAQMEQLQGQLGALPQNNRKN